MSRASILGPRPSFRPAAWLAVVAWLVALVSLGRAAPAGMDWNDAEIRWQPYTLALSMAKREGKPICVVVYAPWCPHCTRYAAVFRDPRVVEKAKDLVMVRIDQDRDASLAGKLAPDGLYVPRTLFLSPSGDLDAEVHAQRHKDRHFFSTTDPAAVLAGMDAALARLR